jgi:hypothetical protein
MKPSIGALLSLVAVTLPAAGQNREARDLASFEAIKVGGGIDLYVRQGEPFRVEVETSDGDTADIVTEVRGGTLEVGHRRSFFDFFDWRGKAASVHVTLPKLVALTSSGGSEVESLGTLTGEQLELTASGGSDVTLDVSVATLEVRTSGGADVDITGNARSTSVQSSGGSDFDASSLTTDSATLASSGGSDISIEVRDSIVANASGGSDISYSGNPPSVTVNASGGADVSRR